MYLKLMKRRDDRSKCRRRQTGRKMDEDSYKLNQQGDEMDKQVRGVRGKTPGSELMKERQRRCGGKNQVAEEP